MMAANAVTPHGVIGDAYASTSTSQQRAVSFGFGSLKTPINSSGEAAASSAAVATASANNSSADNPSASSNNKETVLRQYKLYRSKPDEFPSYDRMRFVRLPREWLPAGLRVDSSSGDPNNNLQHWPALVYQNLAELVRDLSPSESSFTKAKLILEHRKCSTTVVARLLAWRGGGDAGNKGGGARSSATNPFEESKLELIRLSGTSLEDNEHSGKYNELISFVDGQLELEDACDALIAKHSSNNGGDGAGDDREVLKHALQFRRAVDMALNCLALDVGADPLPAREEDEAAVFKTPKNGNGGGNEQQLKSSMKKNLLNNDGGTKQNSKKSVFSVEKSKPIDRTTAAVAQKATQNGRTENHAKSQQEKKSKKRSKKAMPDKENDLNERSGKPTKKPIGPSKGLTARKVEPKKSPKKIKPTKSYGKAATTKQSSFSRPPSKPTSARSTTNESTSFDFEESSQPSSAEAAAAALEEVVKQQIIITPWKEVWAAMKRSGWSWKGGSGLMTDYYYIKPGRKVKDGIEGQDYFISVEGAKEYARTVYGWGKQEVDRDTLMSTIEEHGKYAGESVPPMKDGLTIDPNEPWSEAWGKMRSSGWTWKAGAGLMMDYYYIKPGCKVKGGSKGQDYFEKEEDVRKFATRNHGWRGDGQGVIASAGTVADNGATALGGKRRSSAGSRLSGEHEAQDGSKRQRVKVATKNTTNRSSVDEEKNATKQAEPEESEDDEDEESILDTRSTYSQTGFESKTLFVEESADENVPPLEHPIQPNDSWSEAWGKMRSSGWTWKIGSGLMMDYYYIKPGCKVSGGVKGQDYFENEDGAKRFAMRNYGWRGERSLLGGSASDKSGRKRRNSSENTTAATVAISNTAKRQKIVPATKSPKHKALASMKAHKALKAKSPQASTVRPPLKPVANAAYTYDKKTIWITMQKEGWRAISAGKYNKLHDWYYVRPNCDPGDGTSKLGVDYFLCEDDAIESEQLAKKTDSKKIGCEEKLPAKSKTDSHKEGMQHVKPKAQDQPGNGLLTPADCRTKPQDPAIPLLSSPDNSCSSTSSEDYYEWTHLWQILQRVGWRATKPGRQNPLHDWYYVRPDRDPSDEHSKLGRHYFLSPQDVIDYVKRKDNEKGKKSRKSMGVILGAFEEEAKAAGES